MVLCPAFRKLERQTAELAKRLRKAAAEWGDVFGLDPEACFFEGHEEMPPFDFKWEGFCPVNAWWLSELCRLAYTPDCREEPRDKEGKLPKRGLILKARTNFEEVCSIHTMGNHVSIYRPKEGEGATIVCFRGTTRKRQWMFNALFRPHSWRRFRQESEIETGFVHSGFYVVFKRLWSRLRPRLEQYPRPWVFTGHSLGGAVAMIGGVVSDADLICTFGAPKIGNNELNQITGNRRIWRFVNRDDLVTRLPLPDKYLKGRQFSHGEPAKRLIGEGEITGYSDPADENELPFAMANLTEELQSPPSWFCDHRIGGYCGRLKMAVFRGDV